MDELLPQQAYKRGLTFWIQWATAMVVSQALLFVLVVNKSGEFSSAYQVMAIISILLALPIYSMWKVYPSHDEFLAGSWRVVIAWITVVVVLESIAFATKTSEVYSREVVLTWTVLSAMCQVISFSCLHVLSRVYFSQNENKTKVAIIGVGSLSDKLQQKLKRSPSEHLLGIIEHTKSALKRDNASTNSLGDISKLRSLITTYQIERLYLALPLGEIKKIETIYIELLDMNVDVIWVPDLGGMLLLNNFISDIDGLPAIHMNESPLTSDKAAGFLKTIIDKALSIVLVVILSPIILGAALAVKLSSPGPIIFKQKRHGWNGKEIKVLKFRSMYLHDDSDVKQATKDDSRVTKVGRFIRKTSIDELPQLYNVLVGEMSLVGPRPHAIRHNDYYTDKIDAYMARHRIKPGITGLAQIKGHRGETETVEQMKARVEYDLRYINNWSIGLDINILLKTPMSLLSKEVY